MFFGGFLLPGLAFIYTRVDTRILYKYCRKCQRHMMADLAGYGVATTIWLYILNKILSFLGPFLRYPHPIVRVEKVQTWVITPNQNFFWIRTWDTPLDPPPFFLSCAKQMDGFCSYFQLPIPFCAFIHKTSVSH